MSLAFLGSIYPHCFILILSVPSLLRFENRRRKERGKRGKRTVVLPPLEDEEIAAAAAAIAANRRAATSSAGSLQSQHAAATALLQDVAVVSAMISSQHVESSVLCTVFIRRNDGRSLWHTCSSSSPRRAGRHVLHHE